LRIAYTASFEKAWKTLEENEKKRAAKTLQNLIVNIRYPALRLKKIQGVHNIWEARVSHSIRMTFQIQDDVIILRNIGRHDETLKKP
jgi:mRNA-degrading endonuclease RelE of RelBE toxin-antitoxin system